jgi:hypothetical protein
MVRRIALAEAQWWPKGHEDANHVVINYKIGEALGVVRLGK